MNVLQSGSGVSSEQDNEVKDWYTRIQGCYTRDLRTPATRDASSSIFGYRNMVPVVAHSHVRRSAVGHLPRKAPASFTNVVTHLTELILQSDYSNKNKKHSRPRDNSFLHARHLPIRCCIQCSHKATGSLEEYTKSIAACLITEMDLPFRGRRSLTHLQHIVDIQGHHGHAVLSLQKVNAGCNQSCTILTLNSPCVPFPDISFRS